MENPVLSPLTSLSPHRPAPVSGLGSCRLLSFSDCSNGEADFTATETERPQRLCCPGRFLSLSWDLDGHRAGGSPMHCGSSFVPCACSELVTSAP